MEDDFEELLCESDLLQDSSQESLTAAATDFSYAESDQEDFVYTSQTSQDWDEPAYDESLLPRASAEDDEDVAIPSTAGTDQDHTVYPKYTSCSPSGACPLIEAVRISLTRSKAHLSKLLMRC